MRYKDIVNCPLLECDGGEGGGDDGTTSSCDIASVVYPFGVGVYPYTIVNTLPKPKKKQKRKKHAKSKKHTIKKRD